VNLRLISFLLLVGPILLCCESPNTLIVKGKVDLPSDYKWNDNYPVQVFARVDNASAPFAKGLVDKESYKFVLSDDDLSASHKSNFKVPKTFVVQFVEFLSFDKTSGAPNYNYVGGQVERGGDIVLPYSHPIKTADLVDLLTKHEDQLSLCNPDKNLKGKVVFELFVDKKGQVQNIKFKRSHLGNQASLSCLRDVIKTVTFPAIEGSYQKELSLEFN